MEALVIADEVIREARYLAGGMEINSKTLALDAIARVKPAAGFLTDAHTLTNFRTSQWVPQLIDRKRYDNWVAAGSKNLAVRANERAREILAAHEVEPLPKEVEKVVSEVLAKRAN